MIKAINIVIGTFYLSYIALFYLNLLRLSLNFSRLRFGGGGCGWICGGYEAEEGKEFGIIILG
jgi:hypothetical protein